MKILATGHEGHLWVGFLILEHLLPALHGIEDRSFNALVVPARFLVFRSVAFLPFWAKDVIAKPLIQIR